MDKFRTVHNQLWNVLMIEPPAQCAEDGAVLIETSVVSLPAVCPPSVRAVSAGAAAAVVGRCPPASAAAAGPAAAAEAVPAPAPGSPGGRAGSAAAPGDCAPSTPQTAPEERETTVSDRAPFCQCTGDW